MPLLTGVSIFCLANQNSAVFTNIFGGASGNEGLGLFSLCLDWQYISSGYSPLYYPMDSLISQGIGVAICVCLFSGAYYTNLWNAQNFPFLSQVLFNEASNATNPIQWNQTAVIGSDNKIDPDALAVEGLPWFATSYALSILVQNMCIAAAITHVFLYHWNDLKAVVGSYSIANLKRKLNPTNWGIGFLKESAAAPRFEEHYDPHYKLMLNYKPVPSWWFGVVLGCSITVALVCIYVGDSTLPWWGLLVSCLCAYFFLLIFGAMQAITGVVFIIQPIIQLIGGYIQPGNPVANMYFTLFVRSMISCHLPGYSNSCFRATTQ
jgi:hypothetical protein